MPDETVEVEGEGERRELARILTPSPDRIAPFCPYFGACGGCAVQHLDLARYREWKRGLAAEALAREGIDQGLLGDLVDAHGEGRRRVTLHGRRQGREIVIGFMRARSHDLVAIDHCPILEPGLAPAPEIARALMAALPGDKPLSFLVTLTLEGLDVDVKGQGVVPEPVRLKLAELARTLGLARLSLHGDVVAQPFSPAHAMSGARVAPPPGGFLQPTRAGEETLVRLVEEALPEARKALDLFAGSGPFALALARRMEVHAVEGEQKALVALMQAARLTQGLRRVTSEARDLFRRPLLLPEYQPYDAVVLDPPRAGAEAVCGQLARSGVPAVAYVSCDAQSFARDAATLIKGGYALTKVTPVDQFRYSHHVELVGVFMKAPPKKTKGRGFGR